MKASPAKYTAPKKKASTEPNQQQKNVQNDIIGASLGISTSSTRKFLDSLSNHPLFQNWANSIGSLQEKYLESATYSKNILAVDKFTTLFLWNPFYNDSSQSPLKALRLKDLKKKTEDTEEVKVTHIIKSYE
jgi:hypothetical protein